MEIKTISFHNLKLLLVSREKKSRRVNLNGAEGVNVGPEQKRERSVEEGKRSTKAIDGING